VTGPVLYVEVDGVPAPPPWRRRSASCSVDNTLLSAIVIIAITLIIDVKRLIRLRFLSNNVAQNTPALEVASLR